MKFRVDLKIFAFLLLMYLTRQIEIYFIIMIFAIIHEMAHLVVGIILKFRPEKIELIPLGLSISFKINLEEYNKKIKKSNLFEVKKILVALAGPLINLVIAIVISNFNILSNIKQTIVYANFLIALFNLLPIYPLDGGRILKGVLHISFGKWKSKKYINEISVITVIFCTFISSIGIYYFKNIAILFIIIYLWLITIRENTIYKKELNIYNIIKSLENN